VRDRIRQAGAAVDAWTRKHCLAGGGSVIGWTVAILLALIITWGVTAVGLPQNPSSELAPLATQVALPQSKDPNDDMEPKDRFALQRDLIEYAADGRVRTWTLIAQVIGAVVLAIGGYFTWRNIQVAQEGQITNRFTQAIGQLGAELKNGDANLEVRLGGIYALERIARDSPRDHWTIMEILTAYVRRNASWTSPSPPDGTVSSPEDVPPELPQEPGALLPLRTDFQAILTVIGRRVRSDQRPEPAGLDLHGTDLRGASLNEAHLERARLDGALLQHATLLGTHLEQASLRGAHLEQAFLAGVRLEPSITLVTAHLQGAFLTDAYLQGARLEGTNLERAFLDGAHLNGASLASARLNDAFLLGAHLEETDSLTQEQVYSALAHGVGAHLPSDWPADWLDRFQEQAEQPARQAAGST
jgi:hypothetical protein